MSVCVGARDDATSTRRLRQWIVTASKQTGDGWDEREIRSGAEEVHVHTSLVP